MICDHFKLFSEFLKICVSFFDHDSKNIKNLKKALNKVSTQAKNLI